MHSPTLRRLAGLTLMGLLLLAGSAPAQVNLLWYKEVVHDGRIYVFNNPNEFKLWETSREMGKSITRVNHGPSGETIVFDSEAAMDLYNFKHNKDSEVRPYKAPEPPKPAAPTTLKIGDGELKFGALIQGWYFADSSPNASNTFRIRRTEIKLSGKITKDWGFEVMFDPSKSQNTAAGQDAKILQDAAVSYIGLKGHEFAIGQKKITLTEEGVRSSSELDFTERSQIVRAVSDRREPGLFYNGTPNNVNDDSNDTVVYSGRVDIKPIKGLMFGGSGSYSGGESKAHLERSRYGLHFVYEGGADLPVLFRGEYVTATDGGTTSDLKRDGFYITGMYTFAKQFRLGLRYDELNKNKDVSGNKIKTITGGFHYLIKGKNINLKADYYRIKEEGRKINNVLEEDYSQFILGAQVAF
jgi:hypothetical protein